MDLFLLHLNLRYMHIIKIFVKYGLLLLTSRELQLLIKPDNNLNKKGKSCAKNRL